MNRQNADSCLSYAYGQHGGAETLTTLIIVVLEITRVCNVTFSYASFVVLTIEHKMQK